MAKINLDSLNRWLMLAANIGVLAGIFFLAFEIRQNSDAIESQSRQGMLEAEVAMLNNLWDYPDTLSSLNAEEVTDEQRGRHRAFFLTMMRTRELAWHEFRSGVMDEATWNSYLLPLLGMSNTRSGKDFFERMQYVGDPEFKAYVAERVRTSSQQ